MTEEIVSILILYVRDIASSGLSKDKVEKLKKTKYGMRYGQVSLAAAMTRVKLTTSLGQGQPHNNNKNSLLKKAPISLRKRPKFLLKYNIF